MGGELWPDDEDEWAEADPYARELRVRQVFAWWPVKASNSMDRYVVPDRWAWMEKCWAIEWRLYKKDKWEIKWRGLPVFKPHADLMSSFYKELNDKYPGLVQLGHEHWTVQEWHVIKNSPYAFSLPLGGSAASGWDAWPASSGFSGVSGVSGFSGVSGVSAANGTMAAGPTPILGGPGASGSSVPPGPQEKPPPQQEDEKDRWDSI